MKISQRIKFTSILAGVVIATGALIGATTMVFGAGVPGDKPIIPSNPDPKPHNPGEKFFGPLSSSWVRYAVNGNNDIHFPGYSPASISAKTLHGCVDDNAEYYYKLSFNWYELTEGGGRRLLAEQHGSIISVNSLTVYGGEIIFSGAVDAWNNLGGPGTSIDLSTAHDYFDKTIAAGMNSGVSWEDVGAFCWSESLLCDPDTDPTCAPTVTPSTASGWFYSDSTVSVGGSYVTGGTSATTQIDGQAAIAFSVYDPNPTVDLSATVHFQHNIYYEDNGFSLGTDDYFKDSSGAHLANNSDGTKNTGVAETKWKVIKTIDGSTYSTSADTTISGVSATTDGSYTKREDADFTVTGLKPGDKRTVCSTISYADKNWYYDSDTHITQNKIVAGQWIDTYTTDAGVLVPGHYAAASEARDQVDHQDYYVDSHSGSGSSMVCATITRANIPDGDPVSPSGTASSYVMFAGESAPIAWDVKAEGVETNRLEYARAIRYLVPVNVGYSSANVMGNKKTTADPCAYYTARSGTSCGNYKDNYWDANNTMTVSHADADFRESMPMKVPDLVGYKYCHSFGYHFVPYYATNNNGLTFSSSDYHADSAKAYWYNFNAVCRTIAKKPTAAVWNGGIFTSGGIRTLVAERFNNITFGDTVSTAPTDATIFGSWSEVLTVTGGNIRDSFNRLVEFASGSVLYTGSTSKSRTPSSVGNSLYPLTIANSSLDDPGHSNISKNTVLEHRLTAYLRRRSVITDEYAGDYTINSSLLWNSGNKIYSIGGNLTIDANIITGENAAGNPLTYSSIYDLPQVVIFVDGDVNITNNAQRIDAWIIATGTINTCSTFVKGVNGSTQGTSADSALYRIWGSDCANQLIFNGPVMAKNLVLNRSFGSNPMTDQMSRMAVAPTSQNGATYYDSATGTIKYADDKNTSRQAPAEIFNLRADTYLWAYAQSSRYDSSFTETYSRELAPRY